ncbi:MAG: aldo/keto reductase [Sphingomonadaceae bacterium]|nr:aldo/keto reductase [Sphingomonadaceae bacterium]
MDRREIGRSGLAIAPLMLGGNVLGWTADEAASFAILDAFLDAGFNAIDTADQYSCWVPGHQGGESERMIGRWLKARGGRDRIVLATKVGSTPPKPGRPGFGRSGWGSDLSAQHIERAVEGSLARLQTDHVDLYQSHLDDPGTPLEETLEAHDRLMRGGKVRAIGASNHATPRLAEALAVSDARGLSRYQSLQPRYNLRDREGFEGGLQSLCLREGLGVLCYSALAQGFLTGHYRTKVQRAQSQWRPPLDAAADARGLRILDALAEVAAAAGATMGQVALAWLVAQPGVTAPIVAVNDLEQLREALGAFMIRLDPATLERLSAAGGPSPPDAPPVAAQDEMGRR